MIDQQHRLSLRQQCALLQVTRSAVYYVPAVLPDESAIANEIHELWLKMPAYGYRKITEQLHRDGYQVNHKRVLRLMREMGLRAIYPQPKTSIAKAEHPKYPYLLDGLAITRPNQVWATDITYIKLPGGFVYLVALIDLYSRYCVGWTLVNSMAVEHCCDMLQAGLATGVRPDIINTDQGAQFTSPAWVRLVESHGIKVSMDGKGRWVDNVYIERFWRTIKYEYIFLQPFETVPALRAAIKRFITEYNYERLHQSLGYATPAEVYRGIAAAKTLIKIADPQVLVAPPSVIYGLQAGLLAHLSAS